MLHASFYFHSGRGSLIAEWYCSHRRCLPFHLIRSLVITWSIDDITIIPTSFLSMIFQFVFFRTSLQNFITVVMWTSCSMPSPRFSIGIVRVCTLFLHYLTSLWPHFPSVSFRAEPTSNLELVYFWNLVQVALHRVSGASNAYGVLTLMVSPHHMFLCGGGMV